jgi:hypothetical protein
MNAEAEQDPACRALPIPVPVLRDFREQKACATGVKLSRLQRWILKAALEGVDTEKERAKLEQAAISSMWERLGGSPGSIRIDRSKIGHLDKKQILAGYFGLTPSRVPRETWWRRWPCDAIPHRTYQSKTVCTSPEKTDT